MLDRMYATFENYLDNQMDERDKLLEEIMNTVDDNRKDISSTIKTKTQELGAGLSASMKDILKERISSTDKTIEDLLNGKDTPLSKIKDSVATIDPLLQSYLEDYDKEGGLRTTINSISSKIDDINTNLGLILDATKNPGTAGKTTSAGGALSIGAPIAQGVADTIGDTIKGLGYMGRGVTSDDFYQNGKYGNYAKYSLPTLKDIYGTMMNKEGTKLLKDDERYGAFDEDNPEKYYKIMYQWLKRNGYASGARRILDDELAWTQEKGLEAIIRPSDGAILTPLSRGDSVLNAGATQNIWDMANNPMKFIRDNLSFPINLPSGIMSGGNYDIQQSMVITLPNVQNYSEFVTALQSDMRFEKMLQDMTINQLTNKNALAKYKYNYK